MILKNKRAIPCELYENTNGNIVEYVEKNIVKELCKSIADIISCGGEYIFSMTQAELSNSSITNSIFYERKVLCEPLVRCKDCKNWRESHSEDEESYCYIDGRTTDSTGYCSWGERREE